MNKYGWKKCIQNYRFHSIFLKNLALIFCIMLLPFVCVLGISTYTYDELQKSEEKSYTDEMVTRVSKDVENLLIEIRDKAILLGYDQDIEMFFWADSVEDDQFYNFGNISKFISMVNVTADVVDSVYVYASHSGGIISNAGRAEYKNFEDKVCLDAWDKNGEKYQIGYLSRTVVGEKKETLSFYYTPRYNTAGKKGAIIINISMKKLAGKLDYGDYIKLQIVGNDQLLYDSTGAQTGSKVEDIQNLMQAEEHEIVICNDLEQFGLKTVLHISSQQLYEKLSNIREFIVVFIVVMLLLTILMAFYISQKLFDPISEILDALEENHGIDEEKILQNKDEVSYIRAAIYETSSQNKNIEEELLSRIKLLKKAQAVALQAQINPHFINNTLETINWMAIRQFGGKNDVSQMLKNLSQILRYSLGDSDTFVTLSEELEYVKKYIFIQQKRCNDGFDVVLKIPKELEECKVIKMMVQPVVENAIHYGIKPYDVRGCLEISVDRIHDVLSITVKDSGLGMAWEEVEEINRAIRKQVIKESDHIGLSNVNQRLILAFGEQYGVTISSCEGTVVELKLPYQI